MSYFHSMYVGNLSLVSVTRQLFLCNWIYLNWVVYSTVHLHVISYLCYLKMSRQRPHLIDTWCFYSHHHFKFYDHLSGIFMTWLSMKSRYIFSFRSAMSGAPGPYRSNETQISVPNVSPWIEEKPLLTWNNLFKR